MVDFDPVTSVLGVTVASHKKSVFSDEDGWSVWRKQNGPCYLGPGSDPGPVPEHTPAMSAAGLQWLDLQRVDFV